MAIFLGCPNFWDFYNSVLHLDFSCCQPSNVASVVNNGFGVVDVSYFFLINVSDITIHKSYNGTNFGQI